jgi:integrase/recombinase XerC
LRLPVNLPNPAHSQFIARSTADPVAETKSLSAAAARELLSLPSGEKPEDYRDRAIMALYLYTGMRLSTGCRLMLEDFHWDHSSTATLRLREKGGRVRIIGVHAAAADAVTRYIAAAGLSSGPLFRPLSSSKPGSALADRAMAPISMYTLLLRYLERLPGSTRPGPPGCGQNVYTPHSLRATTATLLLDSGVDITKVQDLLGHRHITTTQIYDKRRRGPRQSASHQMPL